MVIHRIPAIFIIAVCIAASIAAVNADEDASFQQDPLPIGMPDPSAVFAEQQGYQYISRTNPDGSQFGIAVLPDGSECDAWELFRQSLQPEQDAPLIGMPDPSAVFAQQKGYQYVSRTNPDGSQYGIAVLPDGSEFDAWELFRQSLQPEQDAPLIGMPDPSAVFAQQKGYQYISRTNPDGSQYGIAVLPDGSEYDAWDLYRVRGRAP